VPALNERDRALIAELAAKLELDQQPRVGDWVVFADGVTRRIAHRYDFETRDLPDIQTDSDGSFHLCDGFVNHSGSLHLPVHRSTLTRTGEQREGRVWIFHHGGSGRDNNVTAMIPFRVYRCSQNAPL
jgi:hypothetical protein